ncbi:DNA repair protein RecN [Rhodobacterales bacterium HKCCE3408]|nr:DNA repair protein RecN [Rhodobacterales bacterium HKCCE3408]
MLRTLEIRDMLIIDRLDLAFRPGLNVLTGETGAGKSILLDSLGFVLGWRGRADLVRTGAEQGEVIAVFDLAEGHPARAVLEEAGLPFEDELILRRVNTPEGRKTAWVNDRRVSGEVLRDLSDVLVELHGQQDDRGLLDPRGHRAMLDDFAGLEAERTAVATAWAARRKAANALAEAEAALAEMRAEEDFLRHAAAELDALDPEPGEEATLDQRRRVMQGAEKMRADVARALEGLGLQGAEGAMGDSLRWLQGLEHSAEGALDGAMAALERAMVELGEAQSEVSRFAEMLDFDPGELERVEERLFAIRGLARKHAVLPDDLSGFADTLRARLADLDSGTGRIEALRSAVAEADARYDAAATALSTARRSAAERLDAAMAAELAPLKLDRAVFSTRIEAAEPGPEGRDSVVFEVATNPGAPAGPLNRIASGGELSRFLLALKVCLTRHQTGLTLIFDEIDRGVGGATADAVGKRLKDLAADGQVLVVTHSPQVAARGAHHWRVSKEVAGGTTLSRVAALSETDRVDELARMLAGDTVTDAARGAARALLSG